jgi:predicted ArsR family transcriptional regulator
VLHHCPFERTAAVDPATVCAVHLGIARGLTEHLPGVEVTGLTARDPGVAACCLSVAIDEG